MDYELLRKHVFDYLNRMLNSSNIFSQYIDIKNHIQSKIGSSGIELTQEDERKLREISWKLVIQGIIVPGYSSDPNSGWPFFSITEYGKECIIKKEILPYDYDEYLADLKKAIPSFDSIVELYISESLNCFLTGTNTASTVMLGVASEKIFLNFLEDFKNSIKNPKTKKKFEDGINKSKKIYDKFLELQKRFSSFSGNISDKSIIPKFKTTTDSIFNLIRNYRNDAGHPTGKKISRRDALRNLLLFHNYAKEMHKLSEYFKKNPLT